jgi:hypothetical protein
VGAYLRKAGKGWVEVEQLILAGGLFEGSYNEETFYVRELSK